jgi:uncharacterized protein (DUF488 family)
MPVEETAGELRTIWTIGHSNRTWEDFLRLLQEFGIELLADVRRLPGSRKHPHFDQENMIGALAHVNIDYEHFVELGGRRTRRLPDSRNDAWQVEAFAAYADFMSTATFADARGRLQQQASRRRTAIMCAEAVPWRCHRRLISDALLIRGWQVLDIMSHGKATPHQLTSFAKVEGELLYYPIQNTAQTGQ